MKQMVFLFSLLIASTSSYSQHRLESDFVNVDGLERFYEVFLPGKYSENKSYPLVFILHGGGGKAKGIINMTRSRFNQLADRDGFIAVYPNGFEKGWNDGARDTLAAARRLNIDDVAFFDAMIANLNKKLNVDKKQIFACGISNGGFMVQRLAIERSGLFKAIGVVAANMSEDQQRMELENPVPVIFICGTSDPLVPYRGGQVTVFGQKRGEVISVDETIAYWKEMNGCTLKSEVFLYPDINKRDESTAVKTIWQNPGNEQLKVANIRVENGGHTWPGGKPYLPKRFIGSTNMDFNACDEMWAFFKSVM